MRVLSVEGAHHLMVVLLPLVVCGYGLLAAAVAVVVVALIGIGVRFYLLTAGGRRKPRLETITYSHYVEKVRWAMQRLGMDYEEEQNAGIIGLLLQGRTVPRLVIPAQRTVIGDSHAILKYIWATYQGTREETKADFLTITPEVHELDKKIDRALGLHARRWMYYHLLKAPAAGMLVWGYHETANVPVWQRAIIRIAYQPLRFILSKMLGVNRENARKSLNVVRGLYDEVDALLADGRSYLCGDRFTIADITLASLGALTTFPPGYTGGSSQHPLPTLDDLLGMGLDAAFISDLRAFRERPTGRHILRMYEQERTHVLADQGAVGEGQNLSKEEGGDAMSEEEEGENGSGGSSNSSSGGGGATAEKEEEKSGIESKGTEADRSSKPTADKKTE